MALPGCAPPASSNIANKHPSRTRTILMKIGFVLRSRFFDVELSPQPLTFVNHIETIP
jgi:hypothetical protein